MGSTRRSFTSEYKAQSVAFVIDGGRPVAEVARNIGVHEMTLGKWVKVARNAAESGKSPDALSAGCTHRSCRHRFIKRAGVTADALHWLTAISKVCRSAGLSPAPAPHAKPAWTRRHARSAAVPIS
jgi:transposase-like protein